MELPPTDLYLLIWLCLSALMHPPLWFVTSCSNSVQMVKQILKYWFEAPLLKAMLSRGIDEKPVFNTGSLDKGMLYGRWNFSFMVWRWGQKFSLSKRRKMRCVSDQGTKRCPLNYIKASRKLKYKKILLFSLKQDKQLQATVM